MGPKLDLSSKLCSIYIYGILLLTGQVVTTGYFKYAREVIVKMKGNLFIERNAHSHCKLRQAHLCHSNLVVDLILSFKTIAIETC